MDIRKWFHRREEIPPPKPHFNPRPKDSESPGTKRLDALEQKSILLERKMQMQADRFAGSSQPVRIRYRAPQMSCRYDPLPELQRQNLQAVMLAQYMNQLMLH